jgi:alkylation response protein AidB-like acyl-CoA dehydrogenase
MNFGLSEEQSRPAEALAALLERDGGGLEAPPASRIGPLVDRWWPELGRLGLLQPAGPSRVARMAAGKKLAERAAWMVFGAEMTRLVARLIDRAAGPAQTELAEFGAELAAGRKLAAAAVTELGRSTDAAGLDTRAAATDGGYRLEGAKEQVSLAPICDRLAVLAAGEQGPLVLLVDPHMRGVDIGQPMDALGYGELLTCPVHFAGVEVAAADALGPFDAEQQADVGQWLRRSEDAVLTANALGLMQRCLDEAARAATAERGGGKPAAAHQLVRFDLAEMLTQLQTAELLALRAAAAADAGERRADELALCAKVFATEAACTVSDQALGILAAAGYRRDHPVARALVQARFGPLAGHSSHAARMAIADAVLARLAPG